MTEEREQEESVSQATPVQAPAQPAGAGPVEKRLTRSRSRRMLAGVAGGLGEYFGVDPILFRLAFAFLALLGGAGVALYIAAWVLIPEEGAVESLGEAGLARATRYAGEEDLSWIWITALVIGGIIVISNLGRMGFSEGAWFWAALLIAAGVWLYRQDTGRRETSPADPPAPAAVAGSGAAASSAHPAASTDATIPSYRTPRPTAPKKPPPSKLGRYTFALTLVTLGLVAMLDNTGALDVDGSEYAAVALTVVGAGLLVASVAGRARGLILWGLLLVPVVLIGSDVTIPLSGGMGERNYHPRTAGELAGTHELFAGQLSFDLTDMQWGEDPVEIEADVFMGQIQVLVPDGVDVHLDGHVQMGAIELFGLNRSGTDVGLNRMEGSGGRSRLVLDAEVFMGEVTVNRSGEPAKELP